MKQLFLMAAVLISVAASAQPYFGLSVNNKGVGAEFGMLAETVEISLAAKMPLMRNDVPTIISLTVGKQFLITKKEEDNYSFTTSIGYANWKVQDFKGYDADLSGMAPIITLNELKLIYGLEVGKDAHLGRVYLKANYCGGVYYSFGMKVFFNRN